MKRIFLACFLLTATCSVTFVQQAKAFAAPMPAAVTSAEFTAKVNLMDSQLGSGNLSAAQATWSQIHDMMLSVLGTTKTHIAGATTTTDKDAYMAVHNNQYSLYKDIWEMKPDLAANRAAMHSKLLTFSATI